MLISDVRPWGGERSDVELNGDRVAAVRPHNPAPAPALGATDDRDRLLFPARGWRRPTGRISSWWTGRRRRAR